MAAFKHLMACVVLILTHASPLGAEDLGRDIYQKTEGSVFLVYLNDSAGNPTALGSAFLIGPRRLITNAHVAEAGSPVIAIGPVRVPAKVERIDEINDLALLSIDVDLTQTPLSLANDKVHIGDQVFAIGNPEGLEKTLSEGIISGIRNFDGRDLLQVTTAISHGSSGGPIINTQGKTVGVAVLFLKEGQSLNFAIPATVVGKFLDGKQSQTDFRSMMQEIETLLARQNQESYSPDESSQFQTDTKRIKMLSKQVLEAQEPSILIRLAHATELLDSNTSVSAARKALGREDEPDAQEALASSLEWEAILGEDQQLKATLYTQATLLLEASLKKAHAPTREYYTVFAFARESQGRAAEAYKLYHLALDAPTDAWSPSRDVALRGLIRNAATLKLVEQRKVWFKQLAGTPAISADDLEDEAYRLSAENAFADAVANFERAAVMSDDGIDWCRAVLTMSSTADSDALLDDGRKCIQKEAVKRSEDIKNLDGALATVNIKMANILVIRGVYSEAINCARDATKLDPSNAGAFDSLGSFNYPQVRA